MATDYVEMATEAAEWLKDDIKLDIDTLDDIQMAHAAWEYCEANDLDEDEHSQSLARAMVAWRQEGLLMKAEQQAEKGSWE